MQLDQPPLCYEAVYLHGTSNLFPRFLPLISHDDRPLCLKKCRGPIRVAIRALIRARGLFTCTCASRILAAASIRERRLFRSARPEVRRQFESGD